MDCATLVKLIDERKQELFELLSSLVKINSENFGEYGREEEVAKYVHKLAQELGLESDIFSPLELDGFENHPDYLAGRNLENRYNVVARWRGEIDEDELMIMGHSDTVPIGDLANWNFPPLSGEIVDGKILGRGAIDDKYALATGLCIIKVLKDAGFKPKKNLLFCAYSDEERGGSHGALAAVMKYPCNSIVNMDGRYNQIWHCGSGGGELKYLFHTKETADSAKYVAKALPVVLEAVEEFANNRKKEMNENKYYAGTIIPETSLRYMGIRAGYDCMDLDRGEVYFVFYTDKTKEEIYAELAEIEKVLAERLAPLGIIGDGFKAETRFFHYVHCEPDSEDVVKMVEASLEATGEKPLVCGSCLSDLSVISKFGSSRAFALGCGRDFSEVGGAHQPNEFIECDKFLKFTKTIANFVLKVLG